MASLIPGYEYDIFISYRHKDNEYDGWVTEFVTNLRKELHATFKEELSIYFDENPHDGILDSHQVQGTVNNKIRSLIFIPILSQTYCDVNSFAWQHEFLAFNSGAVGDRFGREIRLANGNVSSRILPVRIHDLDAEDKELFEKETGTVLRSIDFIYRAAGVNRPLKPNDERSVNQNHTYYRDQINKVANAVKEIIAALRTANPVKNPAAVLQAEGIQTRSAALITKKWRGPAIIVSSFILLMLLSLASYLMPRKDALADKPKDISIAVLPFANLSNDPGQEYFSDGITDQIITSISHLDNAKVIARTSVMKYKNTVASIEEIGQALDVNYVLEGSVQKAGNKVKINTQLIRVEDSFHEWAEIFEGDLTDIFKVQDDISYAVAQALGKKLNNTVLVKDRPSNLAAYDYFLQAKHVAFNQYYWIRDEKINERFMVAKKLYEKAIELDPSFAPAYAGLADLYDEVRNHDRKNFPADLNRLRLELAEKAFSLDPNSALVNNVRGYMFINATEPNLDSGHYYLRRAAALEEDDYYFNWCLGIFYSIDAGLHEKAVPYLLKAKEINPQDPKVHASLGFALMQVGRAGEGVAHLQSAMDLAGTSNFFGKWFVVFWLLQEDQTGRAEHMMKTSPGYDTEDWMILLDAAKGHREKLSKVKENVALYYYLLGMNREALQAIEVSIDKGGNWFRTLKDNSQWQSLKTEADYPRVLEKARILHEKYTERFK